MRGKRYTEETKISAIKDLNSGVAIKDICRKYGISDGTVYHWKSKFSGMEVNEAKKYKQLEEENRKLKRIVADQALDIVMLKDINSRKW